MNGNGYLKDTLLIAMERARTGALDRRQMLKLGALIGAAGLLPGVAAAQAKEIVFAMWGGDAEEGYSKVWGEPFTARTGIPVVMDGTGPSPGRVRAMVDAGNVTWDIIDGGVGTQASLGALDAVEEIDYAIFDREKVLPGMDYRWGSTVFVYGSVMTYDSAAFKGEEPQNWADFWDVKRFPGKRVFYKYMAGALEAALLADGVPLDQLYPLDVERALAKIEEIKDHIVLWDTGASSQQLFRDGEVTMGQLWHTRANLLADESGGRFRYTFNQGMLQPGVMSVAKNNPAGKQLAMEFLASMQDPKSQLELFDLLGNGPANPEAVAMLSAEQNKGNPGSPENLKSMVLQNADWYGENIVPVTKRFLDLLSS